MGFNWLFGRRANTQSNSGAVPANSTPTSLNERSAHRGKSLSKGELLASTLLALEPRIVFDGAMAATAGDMADQVAADQAASVDVFAEQSQELQSSDELIAALTVDEPQANEIVFIDGNVPDIEVLLAGIDPDIEVVILSTDTDGVEQIASHLEGRSNIDGIHIIAHGRPGTLDLGTAKLTEASINNKHADEIATIRAALSENADFLIYGCNFADQARGESAVEALALATGADVAASTDLTGAAALGGDWDLEVTAGSVETAALSAENWDHVLIVDSASNASTDPADFDFVNTGGSDNFSLNSGESLLIESGTFTGNINSLSAGATIVVAEGATFNPGNINNWSGELIVLGDATLGNTNLNDGAAIQNEGTLTFNSSPNLNGDVTFINHTEGEVDFLNGFSLNSAGIELTNNGTIDIEGNFQGNAGTLTNNGIFDVSQTITLNNAVAAVNNSVFVAENGLTNNGSTLENNGNIVLTGASSSLVNNSGTFTNGPDARVSGANFTNNSTVAGGGEFVFSGQTVNQGTFGGTNGETINFFDTSPTGTQIFDSGNAPTNTTNDSATAVQPNDPVGGIVPTGPAPTIDLDFASDNAPVPGQDGFASLDLTTLLPENIGNDGQTEEEDGEGEFARFTDAGTIDGQDVDVVLTVVRLITDTNEFSGAAPLQDDSTNINVDNPVLEVNNGSAQVTVGNNSTGSDRAITFELRVNIVAAGTDTPVSGNFAFLVNDLDFTSAAAFEEVGVLTSDLDSFVIGNGGIGDPLDPTDDDDDETPQSGPISDIRVLDSEENTIFIGSNSPTDFPTTELIRFRAIDLNGNGGIQRVSPANSIQLNFTNTDEFSLIINRRSSGGGFGLNAGFDQGVFAESVVVDTNADFANIFTEGEAPVAIASDAIQISDDIDSIDSATIVLTNPQPNDLIAVTGTLPAGIIATVNSDNSITLSGNATPDDYEQAILAITFENTSTNPDDVTIREIEITVTDNEAQTSNTGISSIRVIEIPTDTDGDGVADDVDVDDDNDGILDINEGVEVVAVGGQLQFNHNEFGGTGTGPTFVSGNSPSVEQVIANGENTVIGAGLTVLMQGGDTSSLFEFDLDGANSQDLEEAIENEDYVELSFTTQDVNLSIRNLFHSFDVGGSNRGDYKVSYFISDDNFATSDILVEDFQFQSGTSGSFNGQFPNPDEFFLDPETRYSIRVYVYDAQNEPAGQITFNDQTFEFNQIIENDADQDGIINRLDIDSDNDGITDNIEAQTTIGFIAPSGTGDPANGGTFVDANRDGLDDNFDAGLIAGGAANGVGFTPVDTDGDGDADFVDTDSDNEGGNDTAEAGLIGTVTGLSADMNDADGDGLFDVFDTQNGTTDDDGFVVNEGIVPLDGTLPDTDGDVSGGVPLIADLDFRDAQNVPDTDGDGVTDNIDIDDDNDGILDTVEDGITALDFSATPLLLVGDDLENLGIGDVYVVPNVGIADDQAIDAVFTIIERPFGDVGQFSAIDNSNTGVPVQANPYVELQVSFVENGSATASNLVGTAVTIDQYAITFSDIDSITNSAVSEVVGFETGSFEQVVLDAGANSLLESGGFVGGNNGGATLTDFDLFRRRDDSGLLDTDNEIFDSSTAATPEENPQNAVTATYLNSSGFTFVFGQTGSDTSSGGLPNGFNLSGEIIPDFDRDGIVNSLDIDSDNDGITDNIEAQTTVGFIAPSGMGDPDNGGTFVDANRDGLDDNFDAGLIAGGAANGVGFTPVDTDGDGDADFVDTDSDNEGGNDTAEAGLTGTATGLSTDMNDADGDGLFDVFDTQNGTDANDGFNVNESIATGAAALPDVDGDASGGVPLTADVDFRDAETIDTDGDGVIDFIDVDDDNDGILDVDEGTRSPLSSASGTLPDGTIYTVTIAPSGTVNFLPNGDLDINASGTNTITITTSAPVDFEFTNTDLDHGQVWNGPVSGNLGTQLITNGSDWLLEAGTVGSDAFSLDGQFVDANPANSFVRTDADWGTLLSSNATEISFRVNNSEGINVTLIGAQDSDSDGIVDRLDIDSDNDGITDNIEAQTTVGFIAPSGTGDPDNSGTFVDVNRDGLDDNFDAGLIAGGAANGVGFTPVDTDGDGDADFVDTDSDNEGGNDTAEAGLTGTATGLSTDMNDADGDGLFDVFDTQNGTDANDGFNVNESIATGALALPDVDGDASGGVPLTADVDFRDAETIDTDGDGVIDFIDVDDDNDGILDIDEIDIPNLTAIDPDLPIANDGSQFFFIGTTAEIRDGRAQFNNPARIADGSTNNSAGLVFDFSAGSEEPNPEFILGLVVGEGDTAETFQLIGNVGGQDAERVTNFDLAIFDENGDLVFEGNTDNLASTNVINVTGFSLTEGLYTVRFAPTSALRLDAAEINEVRFLDSNDSILPSSGGAIPNNVKLGVGVGSDFDNDGIFDHLDIDSDNDGITDNIEAQTTNGFIAPSGMGDPDNGGTFVDANRDGLDDNFDAGLIAGGAANGVGFIPVDTDGDGDADFVDTDSDNEGGNDTAEAGLTGTATGLSTDMNDADGDGLFDVFDTQNGTADDDGFNVNESIATGAAALPDSDMDASGGVPLEQDVDFRDALNTTAPVAQDDEFTIFEDPEAGTAEIGVITNGNLLADNGDGVDSDVNGDPLTVTQINGVNITNGQQVTLPSGALLTIRTDGTFDYDPNGAFDSLGDGEQGTETFTYTLSDGTVADTDTATVTITINGNNDAPIIDLNGPDEDGEDFAAVFVEDQEGQPLANLLTLDAVVQDDEDNIAAVSVIPILPDPNDGEEEFLRVVSDDPAIDVSIRLSDGQILIDGEVSTTGQSIAFGETEFVISYIQDFTFTVDDSTDDVAQDSDQLTMPTTAVGNAIEFRSANGGTIESDDLEGFLRLLAYQNTDQNNTDGVREFIFQVTEPAGTTVATSSITVERTNDAPIPTANAQSDGRVVDDSTGEEPVPALVITPQSNVAVAELTGDQVRAAIAAAQPGDNVAEELGLISVADLLAQLDISDVEQSEFGIGVIFADETQGRFQYVRTDLPDHEFTDFELNDPNNDSSKPIPDDQALILSADTYIRFIAEPGLINDAGLTFRVSDLSDDVPSNPPSFVVDDSGGVAPTNTSSLSTASFSISLVADTDGDGITNDIDIDDDNDGILDTVEAAAGDNQSGFFQVISDQLNILDPDTGLYIPVGEPTGFNYNALGYNVVDDQLYAFTQGSGVDSEGTSFSGPTVISIDPNTGDVTVVGPTSVTFTAAAGYVENNILYLASASMNQGIAAFDLATGVTTFPVTDNFPVVDISIIDGIAYGIRNSNLFTADLTTGVVSTIPLDLNGAPRSVNWGASFVAEGDRLYFAENSGQLYEVLDYTTGSPSLEFVLNTASTSANDGASNPLLPFILTADSDGDGIIDSLDIDSDNDGITDNIEAQTTAGFIAPSGTGDPDNGGTFVDANRDGLDDNFDAGVIAGGVATGVGLTPVDTDSDGTIDVLDTDSDDDGLSDNAENGLNQGDIATGTLSDASTDADGDGLFDVFENAIDGDAGDGFVVSEGVNDPLAAAANQNGYLPDSVDGDASGGVPLLADLDFRDAQDDTDTDGDGVRDEIDIDDDNDGILDVVEDAGEVLDTFPNFAGGAINTHTDSQTLVAFNGTPVEVSLSSETDAHLTNTPFVAGFHLGDDVLNEEITFSLDRAVTELRIEFNGLEFNEEFRLNINGETHIFDPAGLTALGATISPTDNTLIVGAPIGSTGAILDGTYTVEVPEGITEFQILHSGSNSGVGYEFSLGGDIIDSGPIDSDSDGIIDSLDIDSDNDGITDNIEAQTTAGFIAPSGTGNPDNGGTFVDVNRDGLDDNFDAGVIAGGVATGVGLTPVDTDGDGDADVLDSDTDNDGIDDADEAGHGEAQIANGTLSTSMNDTDGDGLFDVFEDALDMASNDGFVVNEGISPLDGTLSDGGGDASIGTATPLVNDLDFRDLNDAPIAENNVAMVDEDNATPATGNIITDNDPTDGLDSDPDGDSITVTMIGGTVVGPTGTTEIVGTFGTLTIAADGSYTYNVDTTNPTVQALANNETLNETFTYTLSDGTEVDTADLVITINGVNDAPVLDNDANDDNDENDATGFQITFTENQGPVSIVDTDVQLTDVEENVVEFEIILTGLAGDQLGVDSTVLNALGIGAGVTGGGVGGQLTTLQTDGQLVLTLTSGGPLTNDQWEQALLAISFTADTDTPELPVEQDRTVTLRAFDANGAPSNLTTTTISVVEENDLPFLDLANPNINLVNANDNAPIFIENGGPVNLTGDVLISDFDDVELLSAAVTFTNPQADDQLIIDGVVVFDDGAVTQATGTVNGVAYTVVLDGGGSPVVSFAGNALLANYDGAFESIQFNNTSENPVLTDRVIEFTVNDRIDSSTTQTSTVTVLPLNDAPVPLNDVGTTDEANTTTIAVLPNDGDLEGDDLTITAIDGMAIAAGESVTLASGATVTLNPDNTLTYDPNGEFEDLAAGSSIRDNFTYTITDNGETGVDNSSDIVGFSTSIDPDPLSNDAVVSITVTGLVDPIETTDNTNTTNEDDTVGVSGNVVSDDDGSGVDSATDNQPRSVVNFGSFPDESTVTNTTVDGVMVSFSAAGQTALAIGQNLTAEVGNFGGESGFLVIAQNALPSEVGDSLDTVIDFDMAVDGVQFNILDLDTSNSLNIQDQVEILAFNNGVAVPVTAAANTAFTDPLGNALTGEGVAAALADDANVFVTIDGPVDQIIVRTTTGPDISVTNPGTQTIGIGDISFENVAENTLNVTDVDGTAITAAPTTIAGSFGTLVVNQDGSYTYTVDPTNATVQALDDGATPLQDVFTYTATDQNGQTSMSTLTIDIEGMNDAPQVQDPSNPGIAANDDVVPDQDNADSADLTGGNAVDFGQFFFDVDMPTDTLTFDIQGLPTGLTFDPMTGVVSGMIDSSASQMGPMMDGVFPVTIEVFDGTETTTVEVLWNVTNPTPVAEDDAFETDEEMAVMDNVITPDGDGDGGTADTDPDGDALTLQGVTDPNNNAVIPFDTPTALSNGSGTLTVSDDGSFTFVPATDFVGAASFDYVLVDEDGATDTATAVIEVLPVNDPPVINLDPNNDNGSLLDALDDGADDGNFQTTFTEGDTPVNVVDVDVAVTDLDDTVATQLVIDIAGLIDADQTGAEILMIGGTSIDLGADFLGNVTVAGTAFQLNYTADTASETGQLSITAVPTDTDVPLTTLSALLTTLTYENTLEDPNSDVVDAMGVDQSADRTFTFTSIDPLGAMSNMAVATVTVEPVNDAPQVESVLPDIMNNDSDAYNGAVMGDATTNEPIDLNAFFSDVDQTDAELAFTATGLPTGLMVVGNEIVGQLDNSASQMGPNGDGVFEVTVTATDSSGATVEQTFTWSIDNPAPIANDDTGTLTEDDASLMGNVITTTTLLGDVADSDPDGDDITVTSVTNGTDTEAVPAGMSVMIEGTMGGTFTLNPDGSYTFESGVDFQDLDATESRDTSVTYTITDDDGATDTATLTITVTGLNDAPVVIDPMDPGDPNNPNVFTGPGNIIPDQTAEDGDAIAPAGGLDVSPFFTDVDAEDLTFSATDLPMGLMIDPATGVISGTIDNSQSQVGNVPGMPGVFDVTITASDGDEMVSTTVRYTITNPSPVAEDDGLTIDEDGTITAANLFADNGNDVDQDPDLDGFTITRVTAGGDVADLAVLADGTNVGGMVTGSDGGTFTVNADGTVDFDPGTEFQDLDDGETRTTQVVYQIDDAEGGTDTAVVTVTVTGSNDGPVVIDPMNPGDPNDPNVFMGAGEIIPSQTGEDAGTIADLDTSPFFADADVEDLTFTLDPATTPSFITITPDGTIEVGVIPADASQTTLNPGGTPGTYVLTVTASDGDLETSTTVTYTITNPEPIAEDDAVTATEDAPVTFDVIADNGNGADNDPDGDTLTVSDVAGDPAQIGTPVEGSNGGVFTINEDGTATFDPNGDFQSLNDGETRETSITYEISDGNGGFDTATVTVTVEGQDDPAITGGPIPTQTNVDGEMITPLATAGAFNIPVGETPTFTATDLPEGLMIDPATGEISGTLDPSASVSGPYETMVTVTLSDGSTATTTIPWTVTNPAPSATDNMATTLPDTPVTLNVLGDDTDPDGDDLIVSEVTQSAEGTVVINPDGTITFTPNMGVTGPVTFDYTISDGEGGTDTATVTINVDPQAPVAPVIPSQMAIDGEMITPIPAGMDFMDPDGDPLTFTATGLPEGLEIDPTTGEITGTIDNDASADGPYTVTVTGTDADGNQISTTFPFDVTNPAPVANDDMTVTPVDTPITLNPIVNDTDPDGDPLAVLNVGPSANGGTVVINPDGTVTYTPPAGFIGADTFTYTVDDGNGGQDTATVTVDVGGDPIDDPDVTPIDPQNVIDSEVITPIDLADFITDPTAQPLTFTVDGLPEGLEFTPAGLITGMPVNTASEGGPNGDGVYPITVTAVDPDGNVVTTTFDITATNPEPEAADDMASTELGEAVTLSVLANDNDPDGDDLTVSEGTPPANGTIVVNDDGTITYTPNDGFEGTDTFTYTITDSNGDTDTATVTVEVSDEPTGLTPLPQVPAQMGDDASALTPVTVGQLFADPEDGMLTFSGGANNPAFIMVAPDGTITGTPPANASQLSNTGTPGVYEVTVIATDANGNETPVTIQYTITNPAPVAEDDAVTTDEDTPFTGSVFTDNGNGVDNDPDGDTFSVSEVNGDPALVGAPVDGSDGGSFTVNADGSVSFDPELDFQDLQVGETRETTVTYTIDDGEGGTDTATVTLTVEGTNDAPIIIDPSNPPVLGEEPPVVELADLIPPLEGEDASPLDPIDISPFLGDADGDPVTTSGGPNNPPFVTITPDGMILIDPPSDASQGTNVPGGQPGEYIVTVFLDDGMGGVTEVEVPLTITNPPPVATNDAVTTDEDTPFMGSVFTDNGNGVDNDPDGDTFSVSEVNGDPALVGAPVDGSDGGSFTINEDGSVSFDPELDFQDLQVGETRETTVTYTIDDGEGGTDTATVTLTVEGTNDAPIIIDPSNPPVLGEEPPVVELADLIPPLEGEDASPLDPIDISPFLGDADGDPVTTSGGPNNPPFVTITPDGMILIDPPSDASQGTNVPGGQPGEYIVTVFLDDGMGGVTEVEVPLTITNPPPVATNDDFETLNVDLIEGNVLDDNGNGADFDPDGDPDLAVSAVNGDPAGLGQPIQGSEGGTFTINADGTFTFDAGADFEDLTSLETRVTSITYTISDGNGGFSTATIFVEVSPSALNIILPESVESVDVERNDIERDDLSWLADFRDEDDSEERRSELPDDFGSDIYSGHNSLATIAVDGVDADHAILFHTLKTDMDVIYLNVDPANPKTKIEQVAFTLDDGSELPVFASQINPRVLMIEVPAGLQDLPLGITVTMNDGTKTSVTLNLDVSGATIEDLKRLETSQDASDESVGNNTAQNDANAPLNQQLEAARQIGRNEVSQIIQSLKG